MMEVYTEYGYGFECECKEKNFIEFIKAHKNRFCKTDDERELYQRIENISDKRNIKDLFDNYYCEQSYCKGAYAAISNIMTRETGYEFSYKYACEECNTPATIVIDFSDLYDLTYKRKKELETKVYDICKRYMAELGITGKPDYLTLKYFG